MKQKVKNDSRTEAILFCAFKPSKNGETPTRVIGFSRLSRVLSIPVSTVRRVCLKFELSQHKYRTIEDLKAYIRSLSKKRECDKDCYALGQLHLRYLTAAETLEAWAARSLVERTILFHR